MSLTKSKEWMDKRRKKIGGSEIAPILGISPYRTAYQLWLEKTGQKEPDDISHLPHVVRGTLGEEACRMLLERNMLKSFRPKMWQGDKEWWGASDDGYNVDDNMIIEIKCQGREWHERASKGEVPPYYMCQVQWNLHVSKASKALFISYKPETEEMHVIEVLPNPEEQAKIQAAVDNFWLNNVLANKAPEMTEKDYVEIKDEKFEELAKEYETLAKEIKAKEERVEQIRESFRAYTATHRAVRSSSGVKVVRSTRAGSVDYTRMAKESGIDVEKYRKASTETLRVILPQYAVQLT